MPRNDGIGGTPRLARYVSIGTPPSGGATPGRPPLPQRTPGETNPDQDRRFRLVAAEGAVVGPRVTLAESVEIARGTLSARDDIMGHMPSRHGDCPTCESEAPCRPFSRALAILDRWDPGRARRVRIVLRTLGLQEPPLPGGAK